MNEENKDVIAADKKAKHRFSSRKLIVVALGFTVGLLLAWFGKLTKVTADFIISMVAIYLASNVGSGLADVFGSLRGKR